MALPNLKMTQFGHFVFSKRKLNVFLMYLFTFSITSTPSPMGQILPPLQYKLSIYLLPIDFKESNSERKVTHNLHTHTHTHITERERERNEERAPLV